MSLERFTYNRCCFISYKFHIDEFSVCEPRKSKILRGTKAQEIVFNILRELDMKYHRSTYVHVPIYTASVPITKSIQSRFATETGHFNFRCLLYFIAHESVNRGLFSTKPTWCF